MACNVWRRYWFTCNIFNNFGKSTAASNINTVFEINLRRVSWDSRNYVYYKYNTETIIYSPPGENCAICLNDMTNDEMVYLNCGHAFHGHCLRDLRSHRDNKCPTCRTTI